MPLQKERPPGPPGGCWPGLVPPLRGAGDPSAAALAAADDPATLPQPVRCVNI
jgi:hypothetical protein